MLGLLFTEPAEYTCTGQYIFFRLPQGETVHSHSNTLPLLAYGGECVGIAPPAGVHRLDEHIQREKCCCTGLS